MRLERISYPNFPTQEIEYRIQAASETVMGKKREQKLAVCTEEETQSLWCEGKRRISLENMIIYNETLSYRPICYVFYLWLICLSIYNVRPRGGRFVSGQLASREGRNATLPSEHASSLGTNSIHQQRRLGWSQESVHEDDECSFQPCCEAEEILGYKDESRRSGCDGAALPA